ncbi:MAG TPA: putative porin [Steroidobacteraceae bacterium]
MNRQLLSRAIAVLLVGAPPAFAQDADIQALKQQLAVLQSKVELLETAQTRTRKSADEAQATADRTADVLAQGNARLSFAGDLRYRNESFDVEYVDRNRNRDRIRARVNASFRVNDTITGQIGLSTGSTDPRSGNQTLDGQNARKDFDLDVAYVAWTPDASWKLTAGKQRYPWLRTGSLFFDGDVNPEGLAVSYSRGNLFAGAFYDWLAERALSFGAPTGTNTDSIVYGAQVGYRIPVSDSVKLTVGATYFDFDGVQGYNPLFGGNSFGNTTTTSAAVCSRTLVAGASCLLSDYDIIEGFVDLGVTVGGRPLRAFVDYARNTAAEVNPAAGRKLDTAISAGLHYGTASAKGTWEAGLIYQRVEKDALFGQLLDSDFGDGNTDTSGFVVKAAHALARNLTVNASLFLNDLSNDVPQAVTVFDTATAPPLDTLVIPDVRDRDYKRLQLDLNFRF